MALDFLLPSDVIISLVHNADEFLSLLFFLDSYIFYIPFFLR